jgi:hypothetical protein
MTIQFWRNEKKHACNAPLLSRVSYTSVEEYRGAGGSYVHLRYASPGSRSLVISQREKGIVVVVNAAALPMYVIVGF